MTETLLINLLFLLIPVITYLVFFEDKKRPYSYNRYLFILSALSMVLCMSFPIQLEIGFIFDLRFVPFIIASLFGGYRIAIPLWIVLNVYRFYIGGDGIFPSFIYSSIVFILVSLSSKAFLQLESKKRIIAASFLSFLAMASYLFYISSYFQPLTSHFWSIVTNVITIHVGGTVIVMILIQKIIHNLKTREKYNDTERLSVISELAASISHEIRNPLTVTSGFLQLLNKSTTLTEEEKKYVDFSMQELKRAENIVSDFLSLAKPQAQYMVQSDLKEEFDYVHNIMLPYANIHDVKMQYEFSNSLQLRYDKSQIQQSLINLFKNGIESMKEKGGNLTVTVSEHKSEIQIIIQDTGVGMSKDEVQRVGKPYYSTKEEGTGLGMLVVFSTVYKLKGKIDIMSEKGKGTTFRISLPASEQKA
ncbi:ATP-binding protein [Bacillus salitolerans]|uniref:histidine kinase n=1 Tax=Bacillus salitolerans TaxID=1437434 RepID=A0ABW4LSC5_9BACI